MGLVGRGVLRHEVEISILFNRADIFREERSLAAFTTRLVTLERILNTKSIAMKTNRRNKMSGEFACKASFMLDQPSLSTVDKACVEKKLTDRLPVC